MDRESPDEPRAIEAVLRYFVRYTIDDSVTVLLYVSVNGIHTRRVPRGSEEGLTVISLRFLKEKKDHFLRSGMDIGTSTTKTAFLAGELSFFSRRAQIF